MGLHSHQISVLRFKDSSSISKPREKRKGEVENNQKNREKGATGEKEKSYRP